MARKTKEEKRIEKEIEVAFNDHGNSRQFNIMDLNKIHAAGLTAGKAGQDIDAAIRSACDIYEVRR